MLGDTFCCSAFACSNPQQALPSADALDRKGIALRQLHPDLYVSDSPLRFLGLEVGARMTIIRLPDGSLFLHSPIAATPELVRQVEALGRVAFLVAPNKFHHLFIDQWKDACPDASVHIAHGLAKKRPELASAKLLGDEAEPGWAGTIDQIVVRGFPLMNEVMFFHRPSATLIATDIAFNIQESSPASTRFAFGLIGTYGSVAPTLLERVFVRDRAVFRGCLEQVLKWPFERVIVAHGDVSEKGGREELIRGYHWALGTNASA